MAEILSHSINTLNVCHHTGLLLCPPNLKFFDPMSLSSYHPIPLVPFIEKSHVKDIKVTVSYLIVLPNISVRTWTSEPDEHTCL